MLKYTTAAIAALAAVGFAGSAMATGLAQTGQVNAETYGVPVNITVEKTVSVWAGNGAHTNPPAINLSMDGSDQTGNNLASADSTVTYITNTGANIQAKVDGSLPADSSNGHINFFIFYNKTQAQAIAAITSNANAPADALIWTNANMGASQTLIADTGVNTTAKTDPLVYASDSPNDLPLPNTYPLTVTYTIAAN